MHRWGLLLLSFFSFHGIEARSDELKACEAADVSVSIPLRSYTLKAGKTEHGGVYSISCTNVDRVDGLRYSGGNISVLCQNGVFEAPKQSCIVDEIESTCQISTQVGVSKNELKMAYDFAGNWLAVESLLSDLPGGHLGHENIAKLTVSCGSKYTSDGSPVTLTNAGGYQVSVPPCAPESKGVCFLDPFSGVRKDFSVEKDLISFVTKGATSGLRNAEGQFLRSSIIYLWNKSSPEVAHFQSGLVKFNYRYRLGNEFKEPLLSILTGFELPGVPSEATGCTLKVSGALAEYSTGDNPVVPVSHQALVFKAQLFGGSGSDKSTRIYYEGGPNPDTGVWLNPPQGVPSTVVANVETGKSKSKLSCKLTVVPQTKVASINFRRYGDCSFFESLRSYYLLDANGLGAQNSGYLKPLVIPGIAAKYGVDKAEIPFRGVLNTAAALSGEIITTPSGKVLMPPLDKRAFSKAVVVARLFDSKAKNKIGEPLYFGTMDLNDYSQTPLFKVDPNAPLSPEQNVVFQVFLAASQPSGFRDLRGSLGGIPYYNFVSNTNQGLPFDRVVPLMNDSCIPYFQTTPSKRSDKLLPFELSRVVQCQYSRPFKVLELMAGNVDLNVLHVVAEHAHQQFPTDLFQAVAPKKCVAKNPSIVKDCWDLKAAGYGVSAQADPYGSHKLCREEKTTMLEQTAISKYPVCTRSGGKIICEEVSKEVSVQVPKTTITYSNACPLPEPHKECGPNLSLRVAGNNQMMLAGLGCAVAYDKSGELVSATLLNQGVLPYSLNMGGVPQSKDTYPFNYSIQKKGYGCIPCRFASDALARGKDIAAETGFLPFDQDMTAAQKPLYSFNKIKAPAECVRDLTVEIKYLTSKNCQGVAKGASHFCQAENLGSQSCSANDGKGGGAVAGKFTLPVCPNAGFEVEHMATSWSPLLIDVLGEGIEISRDSGMALYFDIAGDGQKRLIDWPVNTQGVAFLALPNQQGEVESIKELFGDYKAKNGFEALSRWDENQDRVIDRSDKIYNQLRLWLDKNRNARAEKEELHILQEFNVEGIYLDYSKLKRTGVEGLTLNSVYYNSRYRDFFNIGDYYFSEYGNRNNRK